MRHATPLHLQTWHKIALGAILFGAILYWILPYFAGTKLVSSYLITEPIAIRWYGLTMAGGLLASIWVVLRRSQAATLAASEQLLSAIIWAIVGGFVGARLLFVILKWPIYAGDLVSILQVSEGGLSLHGALLGGVIATLLYARRTKLDWWRLADTLVVGVPLGQAIGRFGNFFNQEAFGGPTNLPWGMFVEPAYRPAGFADAAFFHPTFLYESLACLALFYFLYRLPTFRTPGQRLLVYLMLYSCIRFVLEFFRIDSDTLGPLSIAQWASLGIIAGGWWLYRHLSKSSL